jgi:CubicO group peptidase (beta-lactamase class C family)
MSWGSQSTLYDLKSTTKSIGVTVLGLALKDGLMDLPDQAQQHLSSVGLPPSSNQNTGWLDDITIEHLSTHTAGFEKTGGFGRLLFRPGTKWFYSDGGANWLADSLTVTYSRDLRALLFQRVFSPLGITSSDLTWRSNNYRSDTINGDKRREFGSGIKADVDAMARIGYLYLRNGQWENQQIIEQSFVDMARQPVSGVTGLPLHNPNQWPGSPDHYGLLWWNNADGELANVPTDAYWSWGLNESLIIVIPSLDIVVSRAGGAWQSS